MQEPFLGHYLIQHKLGVGGYGTVYLGYDTIAKTKIVLKFVKKNNRIRIVNESAIMGILSHKNIARLYRTIEMQDYFVFIMEYVEGCNLGELIKKKGKFSESEGIKIMVQIADALSYLHIHNVFHGDIKPENIMVTSNGIIKLIDFGLSCFIDDYQVIRGNSGTPFYIAPEIEKGEHGKKADVWAAGVTFFLILSGIQNTKMSFYEGIVKDKFSFNFVENKRLKYILKSMTFENPKIRPEFSEIYEQLGGKKINKDPKFHQIIRWKELNVVIIKKMERLGIPRQSSLKNIRVSWTTENKIYLLISTRFINEWGYFGFGEIISCSDYLRLLRKYGLKFLYHGNYFGDSNLLCGNRKYKIQVKTSDELVMKWKLWEGCKQ